MREWMGRKTVGSRRLRWIQLTDDHRGMEEQTVEAQHMPGQIHIQGMLSEKDFQKYTSVPIKDD